MQYRDSLEVAIALGELKSGKKKLELQRNLKHQNSQVREVEELLLLLNSRQYNLLQLQKSCQE
jgi:hypothetical protein